MERERGEPGVDLTNGKLDESGSMRNGNKLTQWAEGLKEEVEGTIVAG